VLFFLSLEDGLQSSKVKDGRRIKRTFFKKGLSKLTQNNCSIKGKWDFRSQKIKIFDFEMWGS
jgi:hypothetical protein